MTTPDGLVDAPTLKESLHLLRNRLIDGINASVRDSKRHEEEYNKLVQQNDVQKATKAIRVSLNQSRKARAFRTLVTAIDLLLEPIIFDIILTSQKGVPEECVQEIVDIAFGIHNLRVYTEAANIYASFVRLYGKKFVLAVKNNKTRFIPPVTTNVRFCFNKNETDLDALVQQRLATDGLSVYIDSSSETEKIIKHLNSLLAWGDIYSQYGPMTPCKMKKAAQMIVAYMKVNKYASAELLVADYLFCLNADIDGFRRMIHLLLNVYRSGINPMTRPEKCPVQQAFYDLLYVGDNGPNLVAFQFIRDEMKKETTKVVETKASQRIKNWFPNRKNVQDFMAALSTGFHFTPNYPDPDLCEDEKILMEDI